MRQKNPEPEDDSDRKLLDDVERVGWHIVGIEEDDTGPGYAFSVGLFHTFKHPEIVLFGLPHETATALINAAGTQVQRGTQYAHGDYHHDLADGYPVSFIQIPTNQYRAYIGYALWFYGSFDFPALQCVWPDKAGRFPWQNVTDQQHDQLQPLLGNPA